MQRTERVDITVYGPHEGDQSTEIMSGRADIVTDTRTEAVTGLSQVVQEWNRQSTTPVGDRPLLTQLVAVAEFTEYGQIAVNGVGREMEEKS